MFKEMKLFAWVGILVGAGYMNSSMASPLPPLEVVPHVDIQRYMGTWYEIASFPQRFQKGCTATSATYSLRENGKKVDVLNQCRLNSVDGKLKTAKGVARVVDTQTNAKLKVSFFWPFSGDYWIIDLGANYEYAVVSAPNRNYLWILSRTRQMDDRTYHEIIEKITKQGLDASRLQLNLQPQE